MRPRLSALPALLLALAACGPIVQLRPPGSAAEPAASAPAAPVAAPAEAAPAAPPAPPPSANAVPGAADAPAPLPVPAAPASAAEPATSHPALWRIARGSTVIWLFGTIHALPAGLAWRDARIGAAEAGAQGLMLETVLDRDPRKAATLLFGIGKAPGLPPLLDRAPADKRDALAAMVARSGVPVALLDSLKTWTAALMLVAVPLADLHVSAADGVEPTLEADFRAAGKPVAGLETPAEQLGFFDALPEAAQREFLTTLLDDPAKMRRDFAAMLAAWTAGDEAGIAATFDDDLKHSAAMREALVTRRNAAWTDWLAARLDRPGTLFVAVGAGHLAGEGSVIARLRAKGIVAERVR